MWRSEGRESRLFFAEVMEGYDVSGLRSALGDRLVFHEELGSTNEEAIKLGHQGAASGSVVLAERQLQGRGRRGTSWFCGEGVGLAFSVLLRPRSDRALWPRLSLVAGLAVAQSIESGGLFAEIKWPNDILISERKVCGILVEAEADFVVVGIGLNVGKVTLPEELQAVATSLGAEGGTEKSREEHLLAIVAKVCSWQDRIDGGFAQILAEVRTRCALSGKQIEFWEGQERKSGFCEGIGDGGELLVREGGEVRRHFAAERIRIIL